MVGESTGIHRHCGSVKLVQMRQMGTGSPGVKTSLPNARHAGLIPVLGAKIPHASGGQNIKQREYHNTIQ